MREIDENIKMVLWSAVKKQGSVLQLSRILGVSHSTILFWLNGKIKNISTDIWCRKLYPVLEEELVCHFFRHECGGKSGRNTAGGRMRLKMGWCSLFPC